jgi:type III secretion protein K
MDTSTTPAPGMPLGLLRLVLRANLQSEESLHSSWLPASWPAHLRTRLGRLGPRARATLGDVLAQHGMLAPAPGYDFDSRVKRLLLLDPPSLRRLAFTTSLCAHAPLLRPRRGGLALLLRRQARRLDPGALEFVLERAPELTALQMSAHPLKERPSGCGRLLVDRGYRLLLAVLAAEGEAAVQRGQRMLPRRVAALEAPALAPRQKDQLVELMLGCIVPERLAQWDWLF